MKHDRTYGQEKWFWARALAMVGREFTIITRYFSPILRLLAFSGYVKSEKFQLVISAILQLLCCQSKKYKKSPGFSVTKMIINSRNPKQIIFSSIILLVVSVRSFSYHSLKSWHLEPQRQTLFFPRRLMSLIRACWAWERGVRTSISLYSSTCDMMISSMVNGMFSSRALRTSRDSRGANNLSSFLATRTRLAKAELESRGQKLHRPNWTATCCCAQRNSGYHLTSLETMLVLFASKTAVIRLLTKSFYFRNRHKKIYRKSLFLYSEK